MKIVHVHDKPFAMPLSVETADARDVTEGGGIEVYLSCIARELLRRGHDLVEIRFGDEEHVAEGSSNPRRYRAMSSSVLPRRAAFDAVEAIVRRERPDLIHLHSPYYAVHPALMSRLCQLCPTVLTQHDVTPFCLNGTRLKNGTSLCEARIGIGCIVDGCFRSHARAGTLQDVARVVMGPAKLGAMRKIPITILPSRYLRDQALLHGFAPEQLRVLPQFSEYGTSAEAPAEAKRILFVGRLVPEKGIGVLLEAFRRLQTPGWEAMVVGEGPLAEAMRQQASRLPGDVRFAGAVSRRDLPAIFAWSNVVVVPSLIPESFGLVGVEAMSFGRPVVAFRAGGVTEWLADGETGFFARHGDVGDLARQIDRLLTDRGLQAAMGHQARRNVHANFQVAPHVDRLESIYEDARRRFHPHRSASAWRELAA